MFLDIIDVRISKNANTIWVASGSFTLQRKPYCGYSTHSSWGTGIWHSTHTAPTWSQPVITAPTPAWYSKGCCPGSLVLLQEAMTAVRSKAKGTGHFTHVLPLLSRTSRRKHWPRSQEQGQGYRAFRPMSCPFCPAPAAANTGKKVRSWNHVYKPRVALECRQYVSVQSGPGRIGQHSSRVLQRPAFLECSRGSLTAFPDNLA